MHLFCIFALSARSHSYGYALSHFKHKSIKRSAINNFVNNFRADSWRIYFIPAKNVTKAGVFLSFLSSSIEIKDILAPKL